MGLWNRLIYVYLSSWILFLFVCVESRYDGVEDLSSDFKIITGDGFDKVRVNDTSVYDSQEDDYLLGYRFKDRSKCLEVFHEDFSLWKHSESFGLYPYKLLMNFYSKMMLVDYVNKWSYFYKPKGKLNSTDDFNYDSNSCTDLTLVFDNGSELIENDTSKYDATNNGNVVGYRFKDGVKCVELRYKNNTVWKFNNDECGEEYPTCLYVNLRSRMVMVDLGDDWSYFENFLKSNRNKNDKNHEDESNLFGEVSKSDLMIKTSSENSLLEENNSEAYDFKQYRYVYEYRFKDGVKCLEVRYKDQVLWKYNHDECQGRYPRSLYVNLYSKMLMLDLDNDWTYFYKYRSEKLTKSRSDSKEVEVFDERAAESGSEDSKTESDDLALANIFVEDKPSYSIPSKNALENKSKEQQSDHDFKDIQLIDLDVESQRTTNRYYYYSDPETKTGVYIAKEGFLFKQVLQFASWYSYNDILLHASKNYYEYSNRVMILGTDKKEIRSIIYFLNGENTHYYTEYNYRSYFGRRQIIEKKVFLEESEYPSKVRIVTYEDSGTKVDDTSKYSVLFQKIYYSNKPDFADLMVYEYRFKDGARCIEFGVRGETVWKFDNDLQRFPQKIFYHDNLDLIFVEFNKHCYNIYKYTANQWKVVHTSEQESISLDIDVKKSSISFFYTKDKKHDVHTYTAKRGYAFNFVKRGETILWDSKGPSEIAYKVIYEKAHTSDEYVAIILTNSEFVLLYRSKGSNNWSDITSERNSLSNVKMLRLDDSGYGNVEIDPNQYDLKTCNFSYGFQFKEGVKCVEIKYSDKTIWKYNEGENVYPKSVFLNLRNNNFLVVDQNSEAEILSGDKNLNRIELDVNNTSSTAEVDAHGDSRFRTYMVKSGYAFESVKKGKEFAWKAKDKNEYATKVTLEITRDKYNISTIFVLEVHLMDKTVMYYTMGTWTLLPFKNKWVQRTNDLHPDEHFPFLKIITCDDPDSEFPLYLENDTNKYKVSKEHIGDLIYEYDYKLEKNLKYLEIKYKDEVLWKDKTFEYVETPNQVRVYLYKQKIYVYDRGLPVSGYDYKNEKKL